MQIFKECLLCQATNIPETNNDRNLSFRQFGRIQSARRIMPPLAGTTLPEQQKGKFLSFFFSFRNVHSLSKKRFLENLHLVMSN